VRAKGDKALERSRRRLAVQARGWAKVLAFQASGYCAAGVEAPAVVDELFEVYKTASELGGPSCLS